MKEQGSGGSSPKNELGNPGEVPHPPGPRFPRWWHQTETARASSYNRGQTCLICAILASPTPTAPSPQERVTPESAGTTPRNALPRERASAGGDTAAE